MISAHPIPDQGETHNTLTGVVFCKSLAYQWSCIMSHARKILRDTGKII